MKLISEVISKLKIMQDQHGDLPVVIEQDYGYHILDSIAHGTDYKIRNQKRDVIVLAG